MATFPVISILILAIISFFLGCYFFILGIIKKKVKRIFIGIGFWILLPFLGKLSEHFQQIDYETRIVRNYVIKEKSEIVLKVFSNKTFTLYKGDKCLKQGNGTWSIWMGDVPELILKLNADELSFEIKSADNKLELIPYPFNNNLDILAGEP